MRIADVQLSFPAILIAFLIDGVARAVLPHDAHGELAITVLILAIAASNWVQYARTVRGSTMVEKNKEYVQAARVIGVAPIAIMRRHLLPNVLGPVLVIATINTATAITTEATLSFLGVGVPATQPSLGTLIRIGNDYLFSGEWWITVFPGAALVIMVLSINLLGDWLRDALNPRLQVGGPGATRVVGLGRGPREAPQSEEASCCVEPQLLLVLPAVLTGCASSGPPWSEVTGERYNMAVDFRFPAVIVSVGTTNGWANGGDLIVDARRPAGGHPGAHEPLVPAAGLAARSWSTSSRASATT